MKKFLFLTYGFVTPTREIMEAWQKWFASFSDKIIEQGHLPFGKEISSAGIIDLPLGIESITGYVIFSAENLDIATKIAQDCPSITSIRVYEIK